jgi:tripartite-type tricarboxylate transporter receptor subunit TctC
MKRLLLAVTLLLGAQFLGAYAPAHAADYPVKPIRIVVPYGPGGATDIVARILGEHLREKFHQPVVVENKPGGNGIVALQETVRAKPDGYTFLIGNITTNLLMPLIGDPPLAFDPFKDLVPVARLNDVPGVFLASKVNFPPGTLQEVVDYARARPGEVNHLTAGILAYSHIDFLMLQKRTGIKLTAIPLRAGAGGGQIDLLNGAVQVALQNAATVTPLVKAGKLKALAVTSEQRLPILPDVPTFKEAGFEGLGTNAWNAMFAPRAVPKEILETMAAAVVEVLTSEKAVKQLEDLQFTVTPTHSLDEARDWLAQDVAHWTPIVADAKTMVDKTQ